MGFLDHVQNLHIHAEKTHKYFGAHYRLPASFMAGVIFFPIFTFPHFHLSAPHRIAGKR